MSLPCASHDTVLLCVRFLYAVCSHKRARTLQRALCVSDGGCSTNMLLWYYRVHGR